MYLGEVRQIYVIYICITITSPPVILARVITLPSKHPQADIESRSNGFVTTEISWEVLACNVTKRASSRNTFYIFPEIGHELFGFMQKVFRGKAHVQTFSGNRRLPSVKGSRCNALCECCGTSAPPPPPPPLEVLYHCRSHYTNKCAM